MWYLSNNKYKSIQIQDRKQRQVNNILKETEYKGGIFMNHYRKLLLGMVATLSLFATATPVFASTGGMTTSHKSFDTGVTSTATVEKASTQSTQAVTTQATQAKLVYGFNAINNDPNQIYFANAQGVKQTGWVKSDGGWHYADSSGKVMRSQWYKDTDGQWYYLGANSQMLSGVNVDGYYLASNGAWQGDSRASAGNYTKVLVGSTFMSVQDVESMISSGKVKINVAHGSALGATKAGTGALTLYLAS